MNLLMYVHICTHMYKQIYINIHKYIYRERLCIRFIQMHIYKSMRVCACACVCAYYTYTYTYKHAHTYI